jgi:hypothetical protein
VQHRTQARRPWGSPSFQGARRDQGPAGRRGRPPRPDRRQGPPRRGLRRGCQSSAPTARTAVRPRPPSSAPTTHGPLAGARGSQAARPARSCRFPTPQRLGTGAPDPRPRPPGRPSTPRLPGPGPRRPAILHAGPSPPSQPSRRPAYRKPRPPDTARTSRTRVDTSWANTSPPPSASAGTARPRPTPTPRSPGNSDSREQP